MKMNNLIIDISYHNGQVDLSKAKESISGVIARCSYGWSDKNIDKQWSNNASQANKLGIPLFAYHFCYARNESEAKKEANLALKACSNYNVSVIYYDLEYSDYQGSLSNEMYYKIAKSFCDEIEKAGYAVGIYANQDWFKTKLVNQGFSAWTLWIANYGSNNGYNNWDNKIQYNPFGNVLLHQFTSNAKKGVLKSIKGINSKFLDCSYDHGLIKTFYKQKETINNLQCGDSVRVKVGSKWYEGQSIASFVFKNCELLDIRSGDEFIDLVLMSRLHKIYSLNIKMDFEIRPLDLNFINYMDLNTIYANIIDNAINSCEKCNDRHIKIQTKADNQYQIIKFTNSCIHTIEINDTFISSNKESDEHGYGLDNIKKTVKKYDGFVQFKFDVDSKEFITIIIFKNNTK